MGLYALIRTGSRFSRLTPPQALDTGTNSVKPQLPGLPPRRGGEKQMPGAKKKATKKKATKKVAAKKAPKKA